MATSKKVRVSADQPLTPTSIRDFHLGVMRRLDNPTIPDAASPLAMNVHFDLLGRVQQRQGITLIGSQISGSSSSVTPNPSMDGRVSRGQPFGPGYPPTASFPQSSSIVSRWLLTESSSTRFDSVGSNHLTDNNTVTSGTGYSNGTSNTDFTTAADFERDNNESLSIDNAPQAGLSSTGSFSIAGWFKLESNGFIQGLFTKWPSSGSTRTFESYINASNKLNLVVSADGATEHSIAGGTSLSTGTYYHAVVVFESATRIQLYINGSSDGSNTSSIPSALNNSANPFVLGAETTAGGFLDGLLQDVIYWNTALSTSDVAAAYALYTTAADESFASIRSGVGTATNSTETTGKEVMLKASTTTDRYIEHRKFAMVFPNPSIPVQATINSGSIEVTVNSKTTTLGSQSISLVGVTTASNTAVSAADYLTFGSTKYATDKTLSGISTAAANTWTLNATALAAINKNDLNKFGLILTCMVDNSAPTWGSGNEASIDINTTDNASDQPVLTLSYTVGTNILGLHQFVDSGGGNNSQLIVNSGGILYYLDGSNVWQSMSSAGGSRTAGVKDRFVNALGRVFVTNPTDGMATWDGDTGGSWDTTNAVDAPAATFLEFFKSKVYAFKTDDNPDRLFFSDVPSTDYAITWDTDNNYLDVHPKDGQDGTGLKKHDQELLIFKKSSLFRYFGTAGSDPEPIYEKGTYSHESIVSTPSGCYFHAGNDGIHVYQSGVGTKISNAVEDIMLAVPKSNYEDIAGWADTDHLYHSLGDITIDNLSFINVASRYTVSTKIWTFYSYPSRLLRGIPYDTGTDIKVAVGDSNSSVYTFNSGNTDNGAAITYTFITKWHELGASPTGSSLLSYPFSISQLAAICDKATGMDLSWQSDDEPITTWHPITKLTKFIWVSKANLAIQGHRVRFRISGSSTSPGWIFNGIELLAGIVKALPVTS